MKTKAKPKNSQAFDAEKAKQLIVYLASKVDIGKTKLMKLLYMIDFAAYEKTGRPITNDTYEHWALGPVPKNIWHQCSTLIAGAIEQTAENRGTGSYTRFHAKKPADLSVFTKGERQVIDSVVERYGHMFQQELVDLVHDELPYRLTRENEVIPYHFAPYRHYKKLTPIQLKRLRENKTYMKRLRDGYRKYRKKKARLATVE